MVASADSSTPSSGAATMREPEKPKIEAKSVSTNSAAVLIDGISVGIDDGQTSQKQLEETKRGEDGNQSEEKEKEEAAQILEADLAKVEGLENEGREERKEIEEEHAGDSNDENIDLTGGWELSKDDKTQDAESEKVPQVKVGNLSEIENANSSPITGLGHEEKRNTARKRVIQMKKPKRNTQTVKVRCC